MSSIHSHEVLHMMLDSAESYTTEGLIAATEARFGADARFHTCSAADISAAMLVDFLANKGKFIPQEAGFNTAASKICQH
ncbi:YecH family metal-binding protein [Candidatus Symbiopectobacterium endolongispinus]|uniref:YecH family metal-binding protein n=1 Tax=Candidatus Symbiopectobacterium endolongispinus TaxID=2812664 RepID=UPI002079B562|nr:YecH family metal-binding protein [Candidatus Symbiopectobacterium endolongispinus]MBT9429276.1 YecH family protein [Candidatus Symbiopectobacterium endolongispinus]